MFLLLLSLLTSIHGGIINDYTSDCYQCNDGISFKDRHHIQRCLASQMNAEACLETCINACKVDETNFYGALHEMFNRLGVWRRYELRAKSSVDFTQPEKNVGRYIRKCVESYGVQVAWSLHQLEDNLECQWRELDFLTEAKYQNCTFKWKSQQDRALFYHQCVSNFPISIFSKRALNQKRQLENLANAMIQHYKDKEQFELVTDSLKATG